LPQSVSILWLAMPVLWLEILIPGSAWAQGPGGAVPVGVTEAREAPVAATVLLTGSVISRTNALVASEIAGLVVALEVREGDRVKRGTPIVRLRRDNLSLRLDAARAQHRESEARLALAQSSHMRNQELFEAGVISQQAFDNAVSESDAWQGRVDQAKAEIGRLEDDLARSVVRAPFTGVVVAEHCQVGAWLAVGSPVVEMIDLDALEVVVDIPERHYAGTRLGATAQVTFSALPDLRIDGTVTALIPRADRQARTFPAKVRIGNPKGRIGVGMLATVALPTGDPRPAIIVPKDAVVRSDAGQVVFVVERAGDGAFARLRPVTLGAGIGAWIEVSGVTAGESVITRGNERIMPDMAVVPEPVEYAAP
jgi:membrane fusion protein (multidrug efflux system)